MIGALGSIYRLCPTYPGYSLPCWSASDLLAQFNAYVVILHQYYQLFTSIFVTNSPDDVIFNAIAVLVLDIFVDSSFNRTRYFGIFLSSAILGNVMTLLMGLDYPSAGASGGIFGLFAATFAYRWAEEKRIDKSTLLLFIAIFASSSILPNVNWMAHLGGSIGGFIIGPLLYYALKNKLERYESISNSSVQTKLIVWTSILLIVIGSTIQFFFFAIGA